jgi:hypothetical protein
MAIVTKGSGGSIRFSGSGGRLYIPGSGGGGGGGSFDPTSISGLVGWYDASDATTFTYATISGLQQVSAWNDKSGLGNHATRNASNANQIIRFSSGGGGVSFASQTHSEWLQTSLIPATGAGGRTIITVVSNPSTQPGYVWSYGTPYNPAPTDNIYALTTNTYNVINPSAGVGTTKWGVVTSPSGVNAHDQIISTESSEFQVGRARKIISTRYDGTTNIIKAGLSTVATTTVTLNTGNTQGFRIGNRVATYGTPSDGGGMVIHEILVYNRDLTDSEWDTAINGLDAKWSAYSFGSTLCPTYGRPINDVDLSTITSGPVNSTFTIPSDYVTVSSNVGNFLYLYRSQTGSEYVASFAMTLTQAGTYQFDSSRSGAGFFGNSVRVYEQTCPDTKTLLASNTANSSTISTSYVYAGGSSKNIIVEGQFINGIGNSVGLTVTKTA